MSERGYARFAVALFAAAALHALLFLAVRTPEQKSSQPLQISIIAPPAKASAPQQTAQHSKPVVEQVSEAAEEQVVVKQSTDQAVSEQVTEQAADSYSAMAALTDQADSPAAVVPDDVQAAILARITYPLRARRHGWQGQAELRFDISRHVIRDINLFLSTGFPILDQAAYQALASMSSLPLHDGSYRLPVMFRIE